MADKSGQSDERKRTDRSRRAIAIGLAASSAGALGATRALQPGKPGSPGEPTPEEAGRLAGSEIVRSDWDLPATRNERVDFFIEYLQGKKHDEMRTWLERLGRYSPMIREELRERGMPEDLVFLAMMESGFDNNAYSTADAVGLWQFIEETGRRHGLEVSSEIDERRDPLKATKAALDYLEALHERFGSWFLAAAAYNTGENRVDRILRERVGGARGDEDLYWQIGPHLPRETRDYVPLMLAAAHIGKDPARYGFPGLEYQSPLSFDEVEVPGGTRLETVAKAAVVAPEEVEDLNPHLIRKRTPPGRTMKVRVPSESAGRFAANWRADTGSQAEPA